jgi:nucleoside-diphosphate-sugar epimerase
MKVLVAGAGGFVGRRLVERLATLGVPVVAGVRAARGYFSAAAIEQRLFDATDAEATRQALAGITHVVNLVMGDGPTMVRSTRNLAESAQELRLTRLVHASSIAVFGHAEGLIGDDHPQGQNADAYGQAKIDCEDIVAEFAVKGLGTVILRPALIYGPGSEPWTARIGRLVQSGRLGDLGASGDGRCNLIHLDDVVEALIAALGAIEAEGRAFNLAMPDPPRWNRYLMDFARSINALPVARVPARNLRIETKLVAIPLKVAEIAGGKIGRPRLLPDPITPSLGRLFALDATYHSLEADRVLGAQRIGYEAGLADAAAWFLGRSGRPQAA